MSTPGLGRLFIFDPKEVKMPRWLMKFEIEGHLGVEREISRLVYRHPAGKYEVHLENQYMEPGCQSPLLMAYIIFDADNIEAAESSGDRHMRSFVDFLPFTTGYRFRIRRALCLFEWTKGIAKHRGTVFQYFPDPSLPQLVLSRQHVLTLERLLLSDTDPDLMRALHWFASGVSAELQDEQFELFWFAVEIMAHRTRKTDKVPDKCAVCHQPLYCPNCQKVSTHRPYPSQEISQLFARHISDEPQRAFEWASAMRHALLHGDEIARVEKETGRTLGWFVDLVGRVAWKSLYSALGDKIGMSDSERLYFIQTDTFGHREIQARADGSFHSPEGRETEFTDIPNLDIKMLVQDAPVSAKDDANS
jgi:hypothetical protein